MHWVDAKEEFHRDARDLGLTAAVRSVASPYGGAREHGAWGIVDGVPVGVRRLVTHEGVHDEVHAALWPPIDLGLHVRAQGTVARWFLDLVGVEDHRTGDEAFDRAFRVAADEGPRAVALLDGEVRAALTALHALEGDADGQVAARDELVAARGAPLGMALRTRAAARAAGAMRRASTMVPRAAELDAFEPAMRRLATSYGFISTSTPLAAEGAIDALAMGVLVRRLANGTRVLEVGCVVDPGMRFELELLPRDARVQAGPPDLFEPAFHLELAPVPWELASHFTVRASPAVKGRIGELLTPPAIAAILRLQEEIDVVLQFGVLTLRRRLDTLEPQALEEVFDRAVAGARTIVPAVAAGYRGGGRG